MALKLYGHPMSLCSRRVLLVLAEKGIDFEFVSVDFLAGEQKRAPYDELMPFGQIPALEDGALRLYGKLLQNIVTTAPSRAIARYLASKYRDQGIDLLPAVDDVQASALFEQFASVEFSQFYDPALQVLTLRLFNPARGEHSDETATKNSIDQLHNKLNVLDKILSTQDYFAGSRFTIVDVFYMPVVIALFYAGEGPAIEQRENLASWWGRVSNRESWKKINETESKA
ncbi:unnamed protein product [Clonostachys rhizophaga]|uniref:glutathione transferase n=1 Tax=Clonostachys rhizophaga TaxID=160324 RepID=A0A9N9YFK2_9HYPO|nr:unnamed protein product [Clonostachys rhizophaga]